MDPISIAMALSQFAPQIIKWVTGSDKAAQAAGAVVEIAKGVTGQSDGSGALAAIQADPAMMLKFRQTMAENEAGLDKAYLVDRQDARARDLELHRLGSSNSRANWMILGDVVGLLGCLSFLYFLPDAPGEVRGMVSMIAGYFGLGLRDAHQFEFGSSRGSKEKDALIKG